MNTQRKISIGFIVNGFRPFDWAGVPKYVERLSRNLVDTGGIEVHCMVSGNTLKRVSVSRDGYHIHYLPTISFLPSVIRSTILFLLSLLVFGLPILRKVKTDIIHGHTAFYGGFQSIIIGLILKKPVVVSFHGNDPIMFLFKRARLIAVQTLTQKAKLIRAGFSRKAIRHIPNCIETTAEGMTLDFSDTPQIAFVGRLTPFKRPDLFLESLVRLRLDQQGVMAVIIGDGRLLWSLKSRVRSLGLSHNVEILGKLDDPFSRLRSGDIYVACSDIDNYLSTSLLEAMYKGMAVIATNVGGTSTAIRNLCNGILVHPSAQSIADGIEMLLSDEALRNHLGKNAKETVKVCFSQNLLNEWFIRCYRIIDSSIDEDFPFFLRPSGVCG